MNKKGEELISNFFGYLFLVILTIIFFALIVGLGNKTVEKTATAVESENLKTDLLLFLRQPIGIYNGRVYTASELIIEGEFNPARLETLENIRPSIERRFEHLGIETFYVWNMLIEYPNGNIIEYGTRKESIDRISRIIAVVNLPGYGEKSIIVTLQKGKIKISEPRGTT